MPESEIVKIQRIYELIEKMGVTRQEKGAQYLSFILNRLSKSPESINVEDLCKSAVQHFRSKQSELTVESVRSELVSLQVNVYKVMSGISVLANPSLKEVLDTYFDGNVNVIQDTEKFLHCLRKVVTKCS